MYLEQYERVQRWYDKFEKINNGRLHDEPSNYYYDDDVLAFFQNCYHLKDWIKNDEAIQTKVNPNPQKSTIRCSEPNCPGRDVTSHAVEEYINSNESLKLCADICNATKHLKVTNPRSKKEPKIGNLDIKLNSNGIIQVKYHIKLNDGTEKDAFELATECVSAWKEYLKTKKLIN